MCVKIRRMGGKFTVEAPYNAEFVKRAKLIRGRWDGRNKVWSFPEECADVVREVLRSVYGEDGSECARVNVRVDISGIDGEEITFCGWSICRRIYRDSPVKMADGVALISGGFGVSGGSRANPRCNPEPGTAVIIYGVPMPKAEEMEEAGAEIIQPAPEPAP